MTKPLRNYARICALAATLALAAWAGAASAQTFSGALTGHWWDPARSGEGQFITFESTGGRNVAYLAYFTYNANGAPTWLVGSGDYAPGAVSVVIPLVTGTGARFGDAFRPGDVTVSSAGTATLEYVSCSQLRMRYAGTQTFTLTLSRLVGPLNGVACTTAPLAANSATDDALRAVLVSARQTGNAAAGRTIPSIDAPLPQLGKLLFFSKALSGNLDSACASCHHPGLGGADALSLSIGTGASNPNLMGPGRALAGGGFSTFRNANTFFNAALWDQGLFWDLRVESLGKITGRNGSGSGIRTPDTAIGIADPLAGPTLPAAQARFPVLNVLEMKGTTAFAGLADGAVRNHIAARIGNYGTGLGALQPSQWLARFRTAFNNPSGSAEQLITFDNIALAIAEYQRSAVFVDNPWARYVRGDNAAISEQAKQGALVFFRTTAQGGAQCSQCHQGDFFTDERMHAVGFPQVGPGLGDGVNGSDDFGRARQTSNIGDRYQFRTPSLLNVELTAPYGHAGAYADLATTFVHYVVPDDTINAFLAARSWCALPQFAATANCAATATDVDRNTRASLAQMKAVRVSSPATAMPVINPASVPQSATAQVVAFMQALTDPCLKDRACFGRWIPAPSEAPDAHQLNAVDASGRAL